MSALFRARDSGFHPRSESDGPPVDRDAQAGSYLTDGVNLYQSLSAIVRGPSHMVGLEECRSLDVVLIPIEELHNRGLRPVIPASAAANEQR
jgi:hypothetical protein